jgi:hypothetical protein
VLSLAKSWRSSIITLFGTRVSAPDQSAQKEIA